MEDNALKEHLRETIRDYWGMSMKEIEFVTGLPPRMIKRSITEMVNSKELKQDGSRYVVA